MSSPLPDADYQQTNPDAISAPNPRQQAEQPSPNHNAAALNLPLAREVIAEAHVYQAYAEGPDDGSQTAEGAARGQSELKEIVMRLRGLRREKESLLPLIEGLETPSQILARVSGEIRSLKSDLEDSTSGRSAAIAYALASETADEEEKLRLQKLTELEARDSLRLDGLEMKEALEELTTRLKQIETDKVAQNVMKLIDGGTPISAIASAEKDALMAALGSITTASTEATSEAEGYVEVYSDVVKSTRFSAEGLLQEFHELEEKLTAVERIVGVDSFGSLTFCYNDITTALVHLTERSLLLDPRRMETLATKASEVAAELDKAMVMKAKIGGEVGYNPVMASEHKIEALYSVLENWASTAHALPKLVNKMKYLSVLSRDAAALEERMQSVEAEISDLKTLLASSERTLELVKEKTGEQIDMTRELLARLSS